MDGPGCTYIEPPGGILGNDHGGRSKQLSSDYEPLLVTTLAFRHECGDQLIRRPGLESFTVVALRPAPSTSVSDQGTSSPSRAPLLGEIEGRDQAFDVRSSGMKPTG